MAGALTDRTSEAAASALARDLGERLRETKKRPRSRLHSFHRWYGKLVPAIPATAIDAFTEPGELVMDPFCGSGTTLLEARLAGRRARGCDLHPLAVLIATVKTRRVEPELLRSCSARLSEGLARIAPGWRDAMPALPNLAHFYPEPVARDLAALLRGADAEGDARVRDWARAVISAVNRDVSNAETRHVFPGVSKRMRALIADGWTADVRARFERAASDRSRAAQDLLEAPDAEDPTVTLSSATEPAPGVAPGSVALVVTNPPYASSIRYAETLKLETAWLGLCAPGADARALDARLLGTERVGKEPLTDDEIEAVPTACGREAASSLRRTAPAKLARCAARFLVELDRAMGAVSAALRPGGHAVLKIAPSRLRGTIVPTPESCVESLEARSIQLVAAIEDAYDPTSRSLTRARNWYSGRIDSDLLLVFRKSP